MSKQFTKEQRAKLLEARRLLNESLSIINQVDGGNLDTGLGKIYIAIQAAKSQLTATVEG